MKRFDPRAVLAQPWFYKSFRNLVTTKAGRVGLVEEFFKPLPGDSILDIGCGTADILDDLPLEVQYFGFDSSEAYIKLARARHGDRGTFVNARVSPDTAKDKFDLVISIGVLHHLPDGDAAELFALAALVLQPGGRLVTVDPVYHDGQAALRKFVISLDRGEHVRTTAEYRDLASASFGQIVETRRTGIVRIPYTHLIMECTR